MKKLLRPLPIFAAALAALLIASCTTTDSKKSSLVAGKTKADNEISVMNFNVENLFDNLHDDNREDQTYLPLSQKQTAQHKAVCAKLDKDYYKDECLNFDWNDDIVNAKLKNVGQIIMGVDGQGPDILLMQEVENDRILGRLNKEQLAKANYKTQVLIEGPDERGIDVALLSRFPIVGTPELHKIPYAGKTDNDKKWMARSRGILEVQLKLPNQENLTVLVAHFPSQANPRYWREQAVSELSKLIKEKSANGMVIAGGDLNITHEEEQEAQFFHKNFSDVAMVSHLVGCKKCDGTHNYRKSWSFLDVLMFSKNMGDTGSTSYKLEPESIAVVNQDPIHIWGQYPKRFKPENKEGVSDHFPLYARIVLRDPVKPATAK